MKCECGAGPKEKEGIVQWWWKWGNEGEHRNYGTEFEKKIRGKQKHRLFPFPNSSVYHCLTQQDLTHKHTHTALRYPM